MFDFQNAPDRRLTYSIKWSIGEDELPMFIADMDFKTAPAVSRAIRNKAALDIYGYHKIPPVFLENPGRNFGKRRASFRKKTGGIFWNPGRNFSAARRSFGKIMIRN